MSLSLWWPAGHLPLTCCVLFADAGSSDHMWTIHSQPSGLLPWKKLCTYISLCVKSGRSLRVFWWNPVMPKLPAWSREAIGLTECFKAERLVDRFAPLQPTLLVGFVSTAVPTYQLINKGRLDQTSSGGPVHVVLPSTWNSACDWMILISHLKSSPFLTGIMHCMFSFSCDTDVTR